MQRIGGGSFNDDGVVADQQVADALAGGESVRPVEDRLGEVVEQRLGDPQGRVRR
jgi:hypothetical protein